LNDLLAGRRILVVEDEMMVLMLIQDILSDFGCEAVEVAATVESALALIETYVFDAVVLDVNLGGVRSFPVAEVLTAREIPFTFATGYGLQGVLDGRSGANVLRKPFRHADVGRVLSQLLTASPPNAAAPLCAD
jgi:CheY-like chemotaxis protein